MPSPFSHTTFSNLIKKFLKVLDNYNSNDLTRSTDSVDSNSSGEVAGICINLALHICYDLAKDSKYLKPSSPATLTSTADQDFIELDVELLLDEIESLNDEANEYKLTKKTWDWYKENFPNPENQSGTPRFYIRRGDKVYLAPRPTSAIDYTAYFVKLQNDLSLDDDFSLLPTQYDYWVIAEAMVEWAKMEDKNSIPPVLISERNEKRQIALNAIGAKFDDFAQSGSNFSNTGAQYSNPYDHI